MRRPRVLRPVVLVLVAALSLAGCVPAASDPDVAPIDPGSLALVEDLRALPFDESKVAIVTAALAGAGVAIADSWDPEAPEVVRITPWQAQNMAAEAANQGGVSGAETVFGSGVGQEFGYFVGSGKPLLQHALGVMAAAGYEGETTATGGFLMNADGRQCAAAFVGRESAAADANTPFADQFVEITGPPIQSL